MGDVPKERNKIHGPSNNLYCMVVPKSGSMENAARIRIAVIDELFAITVICGPII